MDVVGSIVVAVLSLVLANMVISPEPPPPQEPVHEEQVDDRG